MTHEQPTSVRIGDGWPPALGDDTYTLTVKQTATPGAGAEHDYTATYGLTVAGPRFTLSPADLHSRFPPPGATGSYAALLPQAVLARATLPWERALTGTLAAGTLPTPFLALLVVSGSAAPAVQPGTLNDLLDPPVGTLGPSITLAPYESGTDTCAYVDLDVPDFATVAPTAADLELLAHLRQADASSKALGEAPADGWFAVVIANRFPAVEQPSTAYLISLEGLTGWLPPNSPSPGTQAIRMAVLSSWGFTDDGHSEQAFSQALLALDSGGLAVAPAGSDPAAAAVLAQGYVPMAHITRQAQTTTSFYRGPLVPLRLDDGARATFSCPDAALRFDPATGMLDVSYAVAWQLGRLLALDDREVAQAIDQWRRAHIERVTRLAGRVLLARRFPSLGLAPDPAGLLRGHAVRRAFARVLAEDLWPRLLRDGTTEPSPTLPVAAAPPATPRPDTLQPASEQAALLRAFRADPRHWLGLLADDEEPIPAVVASWLGRVQQLYGLPFGLLVPDAHALAPESIRFFYLDPAWIAALSDGALSVGRTTTLDAEHDAAVVAFVDAAAATARNAVRSGALGIAPAAPAGGPLSGFLLRSSAIASWRGVEIAVYADAARRQPLTLVRLDRVSDNVLLCLVDGALAAVRFTQPTEGLQLGVEATGGWNVPLRGLDVGGKPAGQALDPTGTLVPRDAQAGVLNVSDSATSLAGALVAAQAWTGGQSLTAGDLAVQLLESGQVVDLTVPTAPAEAPARAPASADALLADGRRALQAFVERELSDDPR